MKKILLLSAIGLVGILSAFNISLRFATIATDLSTEDPSAYIAASTYTSSNQYGKYISKVVKTPRGKFRVRLVATNLTNPKIKILTDTATSKKCKNNCPIKSLKYFYNIDKAFAAINGTYYCPYDYASCKGKTGTYFWRVFNSRKKNMLNQSNGYTKYDPLMVFDTNNKFYYFHHASDFKKVPDFETKYKTKVQAAISGTELIYKKKITLPRSKLDSKQKYVKSSRGAFGIKGTVAYIALASNATVVDMASIMKALGLDYAINLDGGGSSALMFNGKYRVGPGRNLANSIIFGKK